MSAQPNMTEQQNVPNGLPPQFGKSNMMPSPVPFNGVDSSHSSRTASPANRIQQIPASQLPPSRSAIPPSQLPPGGTNINQLTQNYAQLSVSQITPISSPKVQQFSTSTPLLIQSVNQPDNERLMQSFNRGFSPVTTNTQGIFSHSADSRFRNANGQSMSTDLKPSNIQGESNNLNSGLLTQTNRIPSNNQINSQSNQINTQAQLDRVRNVAQGSGGGAQPKMQQSLSQPLLETHFKDVPLSTAPGSIPQAKPQVLQPQALPSYGSTPNLYQNQMNQNNNSQQGFNSHQNFVTGLPRRDLGPAVPPPLPFPQQNMPNRSIASQGQLQQAFLPQQRLPQAQTVQLRYPSQRVANVPPIMQPPVMQPSLGPTLQPSVVPTLQPSMAQTMQPNVAPTLQPSVIQPNVAPPLSNNANQSLKANLHANRYPNSPQNMGAPSQPNQSAYQPQPNNQTGYQQNYNVVQGGFNKLWGQENYDLLQCPNILPPTKIDPPKISLGQDFLDAANCSPDIFRCTMTKIPESNTLLQKSRLPLGILIHPFKDLDHLPVIQCSTIVRCRACRTYINPFVFFVDMKRWKCNLCYRVNELPEEFQFDPVSKTYGDPSRRPEIKSSTIEYIAPSEYMLRPPQPAVYLFLLDVSHAAVESGYLHSFCNVLSANLTSLPGDARMQIGFIAYNSALHFYSFADGLSQPHEMTVLDIEDIFLPCPDNLVVNLHERKELIADLLAQLPTRFVNSYDTGSALGTALQAAHKMIGSTGGRITVFQGALPMLGPGALSVREDPSQRAGAEVQHLNPANDFYKRLALECSGQQIAVDLFIVNSQYVDLATLSGISRFSGGSIHHFPLFKANRTLQAENLERTLKRYLTRKIGFEAVMRIRCTRGLAIHTFHGNFFVRSTDLLSLPNVNPEAGFGMQVSIEETLSDLHTVCFQAALLYTSSKGERRIRVHTLCVPIASTLPDVLASADQQCIIGLLAKMAVDRSMQSSLPDAREAFINVAIDILSSYKLSLNLGTGQSGLLAPEGMKLLPLYISALLKYLAFRTGISTRLDDRVKAMCDMKSLPLYLLIQKIYPDLYPVHNLEEQNTTLSIDGDAIPQPPRLQLTARSLDSKGAFLLDMGEHMVLLVGPAVSQTFLNEALGVPDYNSITDQMYDLPNLDTPHNQRLNIFINYLNDEKPFVATIQIIRENSPHRNIFIEHLIEDRIETALSYHEFLQHLKTQVK